MARISVVLTYLLLRSDFLLAFTLPVEFSLVENVNERVLPSADDGLDVGPKLGKLYFLP